MNIKLWSGVFFVFYFLSKFLMINEKDGINDDKGQNCIINKRVQWNKQGQFAKGEIFGTKCFYFNSVTQ